MLLTLVDKFQAVGRYRHTVNGQALRIGYSKADGKHLTSLFANSLDCSGFGELLDSLKLSLTIYSLVFPQIPRTSPSVKWRYRGGGHLGNRLGSY